MVGAVRSDQERVEVGHMHASCRRPIGRNQDQTGDRGQSCPSAGRRVMADRMDLAGGGLR